MDIITNFHDSDLFIPTLVFIVLLFFFILYLNSKRQERKINGLFLVIEPYNGQTKTVKLIELTSIQVNKLKKTAEATKNDTTHDPQPWKRSLEELRLSSSSVFDWKPINGASNQKYVKNDILSIEFVHGAPVIGISLSIPFAPKL